MVLKYCTTTVMKILLLLQLLSGKSTRVINCWNLWKLLCLLFCAQSTVNNNSSTKVISAQFIVAHFIFYACCTIIEFIVLEYMIITNFGF